jgi:hypothetical protein
MPLFGAPELNFTVHCVEPAPVIDWFAQLSDCSRTCFLSFSDDTDLTANAASPSTTRILACF